LYILIAKRKRRKTRNTGNLQTTLRGILRRMKSSIEMVAQAWMIRELVERGIN